MTATLEWQDSYSVGVKILDDQHQSMLQIINGLINQQQKEYNADKLAEVISSLIHHAYIHFATEEGYLIQAHYPDLEKHILEHVGFIKKTLELSLNIKENAKDQRQDLINYLKNWYSLHILGSDRFYMKSLAESGIK